ncbi:MAG: hypothetical protein ACP5SF_05330 [Thermoplasmata archaeon]
MNSDDFQKKLKGYQEPLSLSVSISLSNYFDIIKYILDDFSNNKNLPIIYISATIPSKSISAVLDVYGIDSKKIFFVDCISHIMMSSTTYSERIVFVESPTMLETIMLKAEYILNKYVMKNSLIIIDSINSLAIHNDMKILSEFLHLFVTYLRSRGAYFIILSMKEQSNDEISNILNFVSDEILEVE